jgi:O-acetyl-ADP-ribose deacetylase (regulator of RNase III)
MVTMKWGHGKVEIIQGDITEQNVDAIVNAANNQLILGAGVAGAIRKKGGPSIQHECNKHGPIKVGEAALTGAGDLKAKYVIHEASMGFGHPTTSASLASSTIESLKIAAKHKIKSIAFPALGTGVSGFPIDQCAQIMGQVIREHMAEEAFPSKVFFVLFDTHSYDIFVKVLQQKSLSS